MEQRLTKTKNLNGAQSVDRALTLLSLVSYFGDSGAALSEIVEQSGLNKPTTRRLLLALIRSGLVEQDSLTRRYQLGEEAYVLGTLASRRYGLLQLARDSLAILSAKTQDTSFLSIQRDSYSVCLHREEGTYEIRTHALQAGYRHPLGVGAGSLAILSALPDEAVDEIIRTNEPTLLADYPNLHPAQMWEDVKTTRQTGFALNPGRILANSWAIGYAIRYPDGSPAGALSIAAIDSRMQPQRQLELAALMRTEARKIETRLAQLQPVNGRLKRLGGSTLKMHRRLEAGEA
ncbi:IclR family transcriptional regulator [Phyllobacterium sp. 0TCS1.6C]|uniref:IclR family transcriptional regulator n=1 Tax=unclassified Phyllobacterium TaxID=2638441 RepID=UPI0022640821|nr:MULTISPECIES: IclR family transcriptional regulator [unclassified Phyllobacterium]MCX8280253.1 IclR family transcriptional regulator [Phyllobacterium sp. 0TCS1.6C]MCX8294186.1 IclR family transcriptional regulator [Phyllobacterium sp. 0TCS1.6A]